jgi:hypothetical protein
LRDETGTTRETEGRRLAGTSVLAEKKDGVNDPRNIFVGAILDGLPRLGSTYPVNVTQANIDAAQET